jgi:hypothetical protein
LFTRISALTRLSDGRIVAADAKTAQLRYFDSTGRFLRIAGGIGQSPSEFINFSGFMRYNGDSLLITDYEGLRVSRADSEGRIAKRWRPRVDGSGRRPGTAPDIAGVFSDGSLLVVDDFSLCSGRTGEYCVDSARYVRTDGEGKVLTEFGTMPSRRIHLAMLPGGGFVSLESRLSAVHVAVAHDQFFYADSETSTVRVFAMDGSLRKIVRANFPRVPIPEGTTGSLFLPAGANPQQIQAEIRDALAIMDAPDHYPPFAAMMLDSEGNIWLRQPGDPAPPPADSVRWWVFDTTGVARRQLKMPTATNDPAGVFLFHITSSFAAKGEIGGDYLLGPLINSDGVHHVRIYRIRKGQAR